VINGTQGFVDKTRVSVGAMEYQGGNGFRNSDMIASQVASNIPANKVEPDHILGENNQFPDGESELGKSLIFRR